MDTPTAVDPRLNLTTRVQHIQHLLDGESDITPDDNIPSPLNQEDTISSSNNINEDGIVDPELRVDHTDNIPPGGPDVPNVSVIPEETVGNSNNREDGSGESLNAVQVRIVLTVFFYLSPDDQGTAVLQYKNSIDQLLEQNQKMTEMVTMVNHEREKMGEQITAEMKENQRLLDVLKDKPRAEEIMAKIP